MADTAPQDIAAEQAVIGGVMLDPARFPEVERLSGADFYQPRHQVIFDAIRGMLDDGRSVDPVTVLSELRATGLLAKVPGGAVYLHDLVVGTPTAANIGWYARTVAEMSLRRKLVEQAERLHRVAVTPGHLDGEHGQDAMLSRAAEILVQTEVLVEDRGLLHEPIDDVVDIDTFMARPSKAENWVVPGLVAQMDVHMILGGEGSGKSFLSRQIAQCVAAGIHPFRPTTHILPRQTLLVDLEVDEETFKDDTRDMRARIIKLGAERQERCMVWHHPAGLNLRDTRDAAEFERRVEYARPALICFGSLYNAYYGGGDHYEQVASDLRQVFNRIRARFGCALWLEHHMPGEDSSGKRPLRPYGSMQWRSWATHGHAMRYLTPTQYELVKFRNDRGKREYPAGIQRGGKLPVSPIWDDEIELVKAIAAEPAGASALGRPAAPALSPSRPRALGSGSQGAA